MWRRDFFRLWTAYAISAAGSSVGYGALPVIAVLVLHAPVFQVSLLSALSGIVSAVIALPLGSVIEFRPKRPIMVGADLLRFAALGSVPVAAMLGVLSYAQLCVVGVTQTAATIVFTAASGANLKSLVPAEHRAEANGRMETTFWVTNSTGPPLGGALISWLGATVTIAIDAASFLGSALGILRMRGREAAPPSRPEGSRRSLDLTTGWRYILGHRALNPLFWNAMLFGGAVIMTSPLITVLLLDDLKFAPWQYGLAAGLPCLGGIAGSRLAKRLVRRFGTHRVLLGSGALRAMWCWLIPLAGPGPIGLTLIVVADTLMLFCAGVFNPTFATYRMETTDDDLLARVSTAWSISSRSAQPLFIAAGGALAAVTGARTAIAVAAALLLASAALLPWHRDREGYGMVTKPSDQSSLSTT